MDTLLAVKGFDSFLKAAAQWLFYSLAKLAIVSVSGRYCVRYNW